MKKWYLAVFLIAALLGAGQFIEFDDLVGNTVEQTESIIKEEGSIEVYFCPQDSCDLKLVDFINSAERTLDCAFYDLNLENVKEALLEKNIPVRMVMDNDYIHKFNHSFVKADSWGLMHNKFCVADGKKVFTGSFNPTENGAFKNNNNVVILNSTSIATNYQDEFDELWSGTFKKGDPISNPSVKISGIVVENYFCPEDSCVERVKEELEAAEESIYFMTFSFTHEGIANVLLIKNQEGLDIKGVMEARQISQYSKYEVFTYQGIDVIKDSNPNNLHHKVFIIDNETVITGSFNPTKGGDERNDENLLIIHDETIAQKYLSEFWRMFN